MFVTIDASGVAIRKGDLQGVVADDGGGLGAWLRFKHGKRRKGVDGGRCRGEGFLFAALVVARGAGALLAQISEIIVARVTIGPGDVNSSAGLYVHLYGGWLSSRIEWNRHQRISLAPRKSRTAAPLARDY